jgi:hypothetical protein
MDEASAAGTGRDGDGRGAAGRTRESLDEVGEALVSSGSCLMPPAAVARHLGVAEAAWPRFARHWEDLVPDPYAAETGTRRLRRYGHFSLSRTGEIVARPVGSFVQPQESNPLYVAVDRRFEPLTGAFEADPALASLIRMLGRIAACLEEADEWTVKVHPFRVVAEAGGTGQPTPEGRHRDGVTLVTSLLIDRVNAAGGESTVYDPDGTEAMRTTLSRPGTLLLGDDRVTLHEVSPVRPLDAARPARRDVLVTTLAPR